jgi:hypothetical protein
MGDAAHRSSGDEGAAATNSQQAGGVVVVRTTRNGPGTWRIDARLAESTVGLGLEDSTGMFIQMPNGAGDYRPAMRVSPDANDVIGLCALRDGRRVVLAGGYALQAVAASLRSGSSALVLTSATQGSVGALGAEFVSAGGGVNLGTGDSLILTYEASSASPDSLGNWFATFARVGTTPSSARHQHPGQSTLPVRFALRQNQPNPFRSRTTIHFDLPVGAVVRLELFDAQGRRVNTLANGFFAAGYQSVTWDPLQNESGRVGGGVYFYRIQAGSFRDRKKLVLMGN